LDSTKDYRFVFIGNGINLTGQVYQLPDMSNPVATIVGVDATYTQGLAGIFTYDNSSAANNPVDVTFDNFVLLNRVPPVLEIFLDGLLFINVSWDSSYQGWTLQTQTDPASGQWTNVEESDLYEAEGRYNYAADGSIGNRFFRLSHP
jgi:hypothetical protein